MEAMQNPMKPETTVIFWRRNQVAFTFRSPIDHAEGKQRIIDALPLQQLDNFLRQQFQVTLRSFEPGDVPHSNDDDDDDDDDHHDDKLTYSSNQRDNLRNPRAKYLFPALGEERGSVLIGFFHLVPAVANKEDHTPAIVNSINQAKFIEGIPISAMPNWLGACTGDVSHGCPLSPPVAVNGNDTCADSPGRWPITVSQLPAELQQANGQGVTVLVLDTAPEPAAIAEALNKVTQETNGLLQDMATGLVEIQSPFTPKLPAMNLATPPAINVYHQVLPGDDDPIGENQPKTGKDIDGNLIGYPITDHGLFVAGIIRTLAPAANIECIRILNDFGVGDTTALTQMLETIVNHVGTDLQLPLIINMSMVVTPYDEELPNFGLDGALADNVREGLLHPLQVLANLGVLVVTSAGNDSDPRSEDMRGIAMAGATRLGPRYPAAFADTIPQIIPVGAIDGTGLPAPYSDYPGANGVATYGGGLLMRDVANSQPGHTHAMEPIDGLRGIYTTPYYPALSENDTNTSVKEPVPFEYPEVDAPNGNAWAYWSGTSFATPIITALTALVLQAEAPDSANTRQAVIDIAGSNTVSWSGLNPVVTGPVIFVQPCAANPTPLQ
jgi:subtilisin family serine protease